MVDGRRESGGERIEEIAGFFRSTFFPFYLSTPSFPLSSFHAHFQSQISQLQSPDTHTGHDRQRRGGEGELKA